MKRKSTKKGQSQTVTCSWWSPVTLLSRTASWGDFFCLFFFFFWQDAWGVMTLCCLWKYIPACQRKTQPDGWGLLGSHLGSVAGAVQVWHLPSAMARLERVEQPAPACGNLLGNDYTLPSRMCLQLQWNMVAVTDGGCKCPPLWWNSLMCW